MMRPSRFLILKITRLERVGMGVWEMPGSSALVLLSWLVREIRPCLLREVHDHQKRK